MSETPALPPESRAGLPAWIPFLALIALFGFAVLVGTRVCPVLSALVFPPGPPLPPGTVTLLETFPSKPGLEEWLYGTDTRPCEVVAYYESRVGGCFYDLNAGCTYDPDWGTKPFDGGVALPAAVCQATETVTGSFRLTWTIRIGAGYTNGGITQFRITREIIN